MTQSGNRRGISASSNGSVTQTQTIDRPGIPLSEVEKHMSVNDAWTVIDNEVYDITEWIPLHPGGDLVRLAAGREATCLFESYHPGSSMQRVKAAIQNKCKHLGKLADGPALPNKSFFHDVQARVEKFLAEKKTPRHYFEAVSALDVALTLFFYAISVYYKTFLNSTWGAIAAGIWTARGGFLMHMGNHGATSKHQWMNWVTGTMMDLIGSTSLGWKFEHQVAHHMDPNEFRRDNDCEIGDPMLRFHPALKRHWWQRNQHITTLLAMSGGALKWTISDYPNFFAQKISNITFRITAADTVHFLFFKLQWALLHVVIPIYLHGWKGWIGNFLLFMVVAGHYLENIFIVNHIQEGLVPPHDPHWANRQVIASANWSAGSPFWNWFSGGLNHQVEHHLFPSISHYNYPAISPIVKQCCKEYNLPYNAFPNFLSAWTAMLCYLRDLGTPKFDKFVEQK